MNHHRILTLGCSWLIAAATALAGPAPQVDKNNKAVITPEEPVPLDTVSLDESFVFSSPIKFTHDQVGRGDALHSDFEYIRRLPISGHWYFQLGANYDRFDFGGHATSFLPNTLQTFNIPIGLSYIMYDHVAFLVEVRPGFYFEHEVTRGAIDIPFNTGGYVPLIAEKLYGVWGFGTSALRHYPVIPTVGLVWLVNDNLQVLAYVPEPKIVYTVHEGLSVWAGGELLGGSYKVDRNNDPKLNATIVDYSEYRAGVGLTYTPVKHWDVNLAAGYAFDRTFDFYRAGKSYTAEPAPYIRLQLTGEF